MKIIISFLITLLVLLVLDFLWLGVIAKSFYDKALGHFFSSEFRFWPTFVFYPLYAAGIVVFVVRPALNQGYSLGKAFLLGAFLGIIAYGTYNFTNFVTFKEWPLKVLLLDTSWGGLVTGLTSLVSYYLSNLWLS